HTRPRTRLDVDFPPSAFVRFEGDPTAIRRKPGVLFREGRLRDRKRLSVADDGKGPPVVVCFRALLDVQEVSPIGRPVERVLVLGGGPQRRFITCAVPSTLEDVPEAARRVR